MPLVTPAVAPFEYCLHIPHDPRAVRVARVDRAELLASEMLTNAIVHAGGEADLRVKWSASGCA
ncbi:MULTISPECIES: hypothetical protein [Streptomyces]|uniref:Histidine kinase-like ATPase domain-containing protein n=1 Tax=Streptomyces lonegramiae TaxID=3075524 RepID=A0ABU2XRP8_9ACTN|nr:hypothetical protein [Streptomyces sp. DSM 41529]MDT0548601.1 hypothetical protein [Streptomyces sp. DSM 41529]